MRVCDAGEYVNTFLFVHRPQYASTIQQWRPILHSHTELRSYRRCGVYISGSYITVRSNIGQVGDQASLLAPMETFNDYTLLVFSYHMLMSDDDTTAALTVYTFSARAMYEKRLLEIRGNHGSSWQTASVCIPKGTYQLAFVATHGLQFLSDIALNHIYLQHSEDCISHGDEGMHMYTGRSMKLIPYNFPSVFWIWLGSVSFKVLYLRVPSQPMLSLLRQFNHTFWRSTKPSTYRGSVKRILYSGWIITHISMGECLTYSSLNSEWKKRLSL